MKYISGAIFGLILSGTSLAVLSLHYKDWHPKGKASTELRQPSDDSGHLFAPPALKADIQSIAETTPPEKIITTQILPYATAMAPTHPVASEPIEVAPTIETTPAEPLLPTSAIDPLQEPKSQSSHADLAALSPLAMVQKNQDQNIPVPQPMLAPPPLSEDEQARVNQALNYMLALEKNRPQSDVPVVAVKPVTAPKVQVQSYKDVASAFDNPQNLPLISIILYDPGTQSANREALVALPMPLTFAIDPLDPLAAKYAATYRAAGHEVVIFAKAVPKSASKADYEKLLETYLQILPQTVGLVDLEFGGFQAEMAASSAIVSYLQSKGRGVVTWDQGKNLAQKIAQRSGAPSALIFRRLGFESSDIKIKLDQAVFRAGQDGQAVVFGDTSAQTIAALMEWQLQGGPNGAVIAPLSAVFDMSE